jgi:sec-independent protein translocase protein TatA
MFNPVFLWSLGTTEIILIVVVILLMFGGKKIPELMRGLGQGMKEFKDASRAEKKEEKPSGDK